MALAHVESPEPAAMPLLHHLQKSECQWKCDQFGRQILLVRLRHASVPSVRRCDRSHLCFKLCELIVLFILSEVAKVNDYTFFVKD